MNKLKYIRIEKTSEGTNYIPDNNFSFDDYFSLLENEPNFERRLVILTIMTWKNVMNWNTTDDMDSLRDNEKMPKYYNELEALENLSQDILEELIIRYNRQNNIDEILGADTNSREE